MNATLSKLRALALAYPGAYEEFPWGERVAKVKGKIFVFMGAAREGFGISVKLPFTADAALMFKFASPTGYGLGKAGWMSARFARGDDVPLPLLAAWIDESYRAVAPKGLVAELDAAGGRPGRAPASAARKAPASAARKAPASAARKAPASAARKAPAAAARKATAATRKTTPRKRANPRGAAKRHRGA